VNNSSYCAWNSRGRAPALGLRKPSPQCRTTAAPGLALQSRPTGRGGPAPKSCRAPNCRLHQRVTIRSQSSSARASSVRPRVRSPSVLHQSVVVIAAVPGRNHPTRPHLRRPYPATPGDLAAPANRRGVVHAHHLDHLAIRHIGMAFRRWPRWHMLRFAPQTVPNTAASSAIAMAVMRGTAWHAGQPCCAGTDPGATITSRKHARLHVKEQVAVVRPTGRTHRP